MSTKKTYLFSSAGLDWNSLFSQLYKRMEWKMPNLQQVMRIGVDSEFRQFLVAGTNAEGWHFTHIQMALEAIFVTRFLKESPGKHDRIPVDEIRKELDDEFQFLQKA